MSVEEYTGYLSVKSGVSLLRRSWLHIESMSLCPIHSFKLVLYIIVFRELNTKGIPQPQYIRVCPMRPHNLPNALI